MILEIKDNGLKFLQDRVKQDYKALFIILPIFTIIFCGSSIVWISKSYSLLYPCIIGYIFYIYLVIVPILKNLYFNSKVILQITSDDKTIEFDCFKSKFISQNRIITFKNELSMLSGFSDSRSTYYDKKISRAVINVDGYQKTFYLFDEFWSNLNAVF